MERGGEGDLHAELIWPVRFAFGDAFNLGRMQGIDLLAALALLLMPHRVGQRQQSREGGRPLSSPAIFRLMSRMTRPRYVRNVLNARLARRNCLAWA